MSVTGQTYASGETVGTPVYKTGANQAAPGLGDDLSSWTSLTLMGGAAELTVTGGHKIVVACRNAEGKCVAASAAMAVVVGS